MSSRLIIALIIMLLAPGVQAHNFVTGKTVTPVYIQEGGELLLNSDDEIHYQKWNSTQLAGKVRIIQYIAGRKSAKKKNSLLIKAVEAANFPQDRFQPTTIVNTDDAIFGTGYFVVGKIEKNKRRYPWAQFVIDGNGQGRVAWRLPEQSSTILVLNKAGQIRVMAIVACMRCSGMRGGGYQKRLYADLWWRNSLSSAVTVVVATAHIAEKSDRLRITLSPEILRRSNLIRNG